jgi:20S proteasome subunit beta 4
MLIGGWSKVEGPKLYWLDYLGSSASVPFAAHGYGAYYVLSLMDRHYHPELSVEEAKVLMGKCLKELQTRFIINLPNFKFKLVDATGTHEVEITPQ